MNFQDRITKFFLGLSHLRSPTLSPTLLLWTIGIWILGGTTAQAIAANPTALNSAASLVLADLYPAQELSNLEATVEVETETSTEATPEIPIETSSKIIETPIETNPETSEISIEKTSEISIEIAPEASVEASAKAFADTAVQELSLPFQETQLSALEPNSEPSTDLVTNAEPTSMIENDFHVSTITHIAAAGPENFNPQLRILPPLSPPPPPAPASEETNSEETNKVESPETSKEPRIFKLENLQVDFRDTQDQSGQHNQWIEPTAEFEIGKRGDRLLFKTGFNTFEEPDTETVTNIPIQVGWQTNLGKSTLKVAAGVDIFKRLPVALNLDVQATVPITPSLTLTGVVNQGPYKANATTLENQITAWRFGPDLYWRINRKTSLFSSLRLGFYNDDNSEVQSFSRLEHKFGQFHAAANLFTWNLKKDMQAESGYFSPPNFLVYNGEVGWEGKPFDFLRCRLTANLGAQRLNDTTTNGYTYQGLCTANLSTSVEVDLGYTVSNIFNRETGEGRSQSQAVISQLRVNF